MYSDYVIQKNDEKHSDIPFIKMHGLGNDFVIIDQRENQFKLSPAAVRKICDRNFGVGCDQLIVLRASENFDCQMLIFNSDGSIARACGNACRCVAKLLNKDTILIQIHDRVVKVEALDRSGNDHLYSVDMGNPLIKWYEIPLRKEIDTMNISFESEYNNKIGSCVNIGNPHLVFFEQSAVDEVFIKKQGPIFENHNMFPDRINVSFAHIVNEKLIKLRVWERGTGLTFACGSAACATHFIAYKKGLVLRQTIVQQPGGDLMIEVGDEGAISMVGTADYIFSGMISKGQLF